jgi:hypothetical protein
MRVNIQGGSFSRYSSADAAVLPPDGMWHQVLFDLTAMNPQFGAVDGLEAVLGSVTEARILSVEGPAPTHQGDILVGQLGMDNLRATTLPGDANFDGRVSFADFQRLELGFGQAPRATAREQWGQGDFNFDERVDFDDFLILRNSFGSSLGGAEAAAVAAFEQGYVPEPSGAVGVVGAGLLAIGTRGSRRVRSSRGRAATGKPESLPVPPNGVVIARMVGGAHPTLPRSRFLLRCNSAARIRPAPGRCRSS